MQADILIICDRTKFSAGLQAFCAKMRKIADHALLVACACLSAPTFASPLDETRYCGEPRRGVRGDIVRRADVLVAFAKRHPCPVTGLPVRSCPGWAIDHVIPLASGGCDAVSNLQWLPVTLKSCAGQCKDRWERRVYRP